MTKIIHTKRLKILISILVLSILLSSLLRYSLIYILEPYFYGHPISIETAANHPDFKECYSERTDLGLNQNPSDIKNYQPKNNTVVAIGDSITYGIDSMPDQDYVSLLSKKMDRPIVNLAVPGDTSEMSLSHIDAALKEDPGVAIVFIGANDYLHNVPLKETNKNIRQLITRLQESGAMVVFIGSRNDLLLKCNNPFFEKNIAKEMQTLFIPNILRDIVHDEMLMSDYIHPNTDGHAALADRIYNEISKFIDFK